MKPQTAQIVFTGKYRDKETACIRYNYVLVSGHIFQYVKDKEQLGTLSLLPKEPLGGVIPNDAYIGLARWISSNDHGKRNTITRIIRKCGAPFWKI